MEESDQLDEMLMEDEKIMTREEDVQVIHKTSYRFKTYNIDRPILWDSRRMTYLVYQKEIDNYGIEYYHGFLQTHSEYTKNMIKHIMCDPHVYIEYTYPSIKDNVERCSDTSMRKGEFYTNGICRY
jgi:hypothetical protein